MPSEIETIRTALEEAREIVQIFGGPGQAEKMRAAISSLAALQEERERMQADSRRLDLMERYEAAVKKREQFGWTVIGWYSPAGKSPQATAKTLRAAIDGALGEGE